MAALSVLVLFGVSCPDPCVVSPRARAMLEQQAVSFLSKKGFQVKPPKAGLPRPTETESEGAVDVAKKRGVQRIVALDLERSGKKLWITQFLSGAPGPWAVHKVACGVKKGGFSCPDFLRVLAMGLRPRTVMDVDMTSALRALAPKVSACVLEEDKVPISERIFGKVELDLILKKSGALKVESIAPAMVARARLGDCLRKVMETIHLGPFEGEAVRFRVPIDL